MADDRFVSTALGARLVCSNAQTNDHVVYWLDGDGQTRAARPATLLEIKMWGLLMSRQSEWSADGELL